MWETPHRVHFANRSWLVCNDFRKAIISWPRRYVSWSATIVRLAYSTASDTSRLHTLKQTGRHARSHAAMLEFRSRTHPVVDWLHLIIKRLLDTLIPSSLFVERHLLASKCITSTLSVILIYPLAYSHTHISLLHSLHSFVRSISLFHKRSTVVVSL